MIASTAYDAFADIYEVWTESAPAAQENLPFYVDACVNTPGTVVELGVGNGRIAVEAARMGKSMIGVDSSHAMLALCQERARQAGVLDQLTLIQADFRDFQLPEPAQLITIPFHSIGHLSSLAAKRDGLNHIHSQLAPGGRLIFDHFIFDEALARHRQRLSRLRAEYVDPKTGRDVFLWVASDYNCAQQTIRIIAWTDELDRDGVVQKRRYRTVDFSWIEPLQARALLEETGFEVETCYGDFRGSPLAEDSSHQVWVARRPLSTV
jgi:SAM-dependent methyltransferase